ncbi:hypothetical protein [Kitasatospora fiedleri]|uniref:hypothetical protein n=1 Tax=Kitasatospora fiedleri TaxID=2991545 RepID=UPI00249B49B0|nr:hypothetical protein [Kitasatospora fiedleri]
MPAERCPRCGTARTAGSCACNAVSPAEETAVLPHLEGPPLVRPYVAGAAVVEPGDPAGDPFATRPLPPPVQPITAAPAAAAPPPSGPPIAVPPSAAQPPAVQPITGPPPGAAPPPPPNRPPHVPQAASPFGPPQPAPAPVQPQPQPRPDADATQVLPPVPAQQQPPRASGAPGRFVPIPPPGAASGQGEVPAAEQTMPLTLGPVKAPPQHPAAGRGAGPDETTRLTPVGGPGGPNGPNGSNGDEPWPAAAGTDLGMFTFREDGADGPISRADHRERRRQSADRRRLVIAGGAVGVTALGASLAMLLSSSPSPVDNALPAPTAPAVVSSADPAPDPAPSGTASPEPSAGSPSPTRTKARPSQTATSKAAAAPTAEAPSASSSPSPDRTSQSPSAAATLRLDDTGPDVTQMQRLLMTVNCNRIGQLDSDRTSGNQPGFGYWTQSVLAVFQHKERKLKGVALGVYDPQTRSALQEAAKAPDC